MDKDIHATGFELPAAFVHAFTSANGSAARMTVVGQFFEREEIALGEDNQVALKPNASHEVYLVGSTSLIHIERQESEDTFYVVQPVPHKTGMIPKDALEDQIVSQLRKGRKLWLLTRKAASPSRRDMPPREHVQESEPLIQKQETAVSTPVIRPHEIVPDTSSPRLAAVKDEGREGESEEVDVQAFGQLRTLLQNVRLQFWHGNARTQPTETITVAEHKAEHRDLKGAIQAIEMLENGFVRLVEQWEHDFHDTERRMKRGGADAGDPQEFRRFRDDHVEMKSRITYTKTKFRLVLNWLRELEAEQKREKQGL
jgi:hypothetical protein